MNRHLIRGHIAKIEPRSFQSFMVSGPSISTVCHESVIFKKYKGMHSTKPPDACKHDPYLDEIGDIFENASGGREITMGGRFWYNRLDKRVTLRIKPLGNTHGDRAICTIRVRGVVLTELSDF